MMHVNPRSIRAGVRNPLLLLPGAAEIRALPPEAKAALRLLLQGIRADAKRRADEAWRKHKAPMAAYWKALSVYAGHTMRLCRVEAVR